MTPDILKNNIIIPTLEMLDLSSKSATALLFGTACVESDCGRYIRQYGFDLDSKKGAFGIYQMELATHEDIWANYLQYHPMFAEKMRKIRDYNGSPQQQLMADPIYATAMARVHYLRVSKKLPRADDIVALASYWKKYYNTEAGQGRVTDFIGKYNHYELI